MESVSDSSTVPAVPVPRQEDVEPYMESGYQRLAQAQYDTGSRHLDPVYAAAAGLWQPASQSTNSEYQYGAFEQAREFERLQDLYRDTVASRSMFEMNGDDMVM